MEARWGRGGLSANGEEPTLGNEVSGGQDGVGGVRSGYERLWGRSLAPVHPVAVGVEYMIWVLGQGQGLERRRISPAVRSQSSLLRLGS